MEGGAGKFRKEKGWKKGLFQKKQTNRSHKTKVWIDWHRYIDAYTVFNSDRGIYCCSVLSEEPGKISISDSSQPDLVFPVHTILHVLEGSTLRPLNDAVHSDHCNVLPFQQQ